MNKKDIVIIVPIYKKHMDYFENISIKQLFRVLGQYPICFIIPNSLIIDYKELELENVFIERFDDYYFSGIEEYGRLCLSPEFYIRFLEYKYILIYQLDAFVFSNRLEEFISYGFDYIGAPWNYSQFCFSNYNNSIWYVGNGGFSLRKTESLLSIISSKKRFFAKCPGDIEDLEICACSGSSFSVAPMHIAREFSVETNVAEEIKKGIPFGCHAWKTYDYFAWKKYIEREGYYLPSSIEGEYNKDYNSRVIMYRDFCRERAHYWEEIFDLQKLKNSINKAFAGEEREYVIWGMGVCGKTLFNLMNSIKLRVKAIIDNNLAYEDNYKFSKIISPDSYIREFQNYRLIIALWKHDSNIIGFLNMYGCKRNVDYILVDDIEEIGKNKKYFPQNRKQLAL